MGGGSVPEEVARQAQELGRRIAEQGWILLNGGRDAGVMAASARGAERADGFVLGIQPTRGPEEGGLAEEVDLSVFTGFGDGRNVLNVLSSDVVCACRGGAGTLSEVALAVKTGTPVVLVDWPEEEIPEQLRGPLLHEAGSPREAVRTVRELVEA